MQTNIILLLLLCLLLFMCMYNEINNNSWFIVCTIIIIIIIVINKYINILFIYYTNNYNNTYLWIYIIIIVSVFGYCYYYYTNKLLLLLLLCLIVCLYNTMRPCAYYFRIQISDLKVRCKRGGNSKTLLGKFPHRHIPKLNAKFIRHMTYTWKVLQIPSGKGYRVSKVYKKHCPPHITLNTSCEFTPSCYVYMLTFSFFQG